MKNQSIPLCDSFKKFISATESGKRKMTSGKKISKGVVKNYI